MHVEVLIGPQTSAEVHVGLALGELSVGEETLAVGGGVDRVVGLVAAFGEAGELTHDDGLVRRVAIGPLGMEVLELMDARVRHVGIRVVHDRGALEVSDVEDLLLQVDRAPAELARAVVEVTVDGAGVDDRDLSDGRLLVEGLGLVEEVDVQLHVDVGVVGHALQPRRVAVGGQPLPGVVEVAVVVGVPHREAADDRRGQLPCVGLPLLGGVVPDEGLEQRTADQTDATLLEVLRLMGVELPRLTRDEGAGLVGGVGRLEELVDRAEVDRQRIHDALVGRVHPVHVVGEGRETVHVLPHRGVRGVEEMSAIAVHLDAGGRLVLAVRVAADVMPSIDDGHPAARGGRALSDREAEEARSDDEEVHLCHFPPVRPALHMRLRREGAPAYSTDRRARSREATEWMSRRGEHPVGPQHAVEHRGERPCVGVRDVVVVDVDRDVPDGSHALPVRAEPGSVVHERHPAIEGLRGILPVEHLLPRDGALPPRV
ncbi:hypothetical protein ABE10_11475, partial [Bacillus toyonensis]|nr:hypothetical protein [Bacillus toyonensis]